MDVRRREEEMSGVWRFCVLFLGEGKERKEVGREGVFAGLRLAGCEDEVNQLDLCIFLPRACVCVAG